MIRIDDSLLEELGLIKLPEQERRQLLKHIYETLETKVGMRLAERMSDQQLDEFEKFIDGNTAYVENYLNVHKPGWQQSPEYAKELQIAHDAASRSGSAVNEVAVKSQFGALAWLETNFPDYKNVVAEELDKLKAEIKQDANKILEATMQPNTVQNNMQTQAQSFQAVPTNEPQQTHYNQMPTSEDSQQSQVDNTQPPIAA